MERLTSNTITEQEISSFQEDGAICLRAVFNQRWIDLLRSGIEYNRLHPSAMTKRKGHSPLFFHDYNNWESIPEYKEFVLHSPLGEIAGRILQSAVRDWTEEIASTFIWH
jgi:ectoine hydroxylase-related dioxygenase (phytanoyl-CoA dioxygenase family)